MAMSLSIVRRLIPSIRAASTLLKASASGTRSGPGFLASIISPPVRSGRRSSSATKQDIRRTNEPVATCRRYNTSPLWPRLARHVRVGRKPPPVDHSGTVMCSLSESNLCLNRYLLRGAGHAVATTLCSRACRVVLVRPSFVLRGLFEPASCKVVNLSVAGLLAQPDFEFAIAFEKNLQRLGNYV